MGEKETWRGWGEVAQKNRQPTISEVKTINDKNTAQNIQRPAIVLQLKVGT